MRIATHHRVHRRDRRLLRSTLAATLALMWLCIPGTAIAETEPDLAQTLDDRPIVHGEHVIETGHIDLGPKYEDDGTWRFMIHDDAARSDSSAPSVWRYPQETVFHVLDAAKLTVPDDPAYEFLGAEPGAEVYVIPQTQNTDVVWLGWNTQDPEVMETIDRGITLSLDGFQGPGRVTVYLQSGSFGEPEILWESSIVERQPLWVDVNTHTHANWVFTEPGIYLLEITAEATLLDGSTVSDTQQLLLAVGSATSPADGLSATSQDDTSGSQASSTPPSAGPDSAGGNTSDPASSGPSPILLGAALLGALALTIWLTVMAVRSQRAKQRVLSARAKHTDSSDGSPRE
ncbi:MAG: choice-of-anchor M domain-containing protein [Propioniciclava sp.]